MFWWKLDGIKRVWESLLQSDDPLLNMIIVYSNELFMWDAELNLSTIVTESRSGEVCHYCILTHICNLQTASINSLLMWTLPLSHFPQCCSYLSLLPCYLLTVSAPQWVMRPLWLLQTQWQWQSKAVAGLRLNPSLLLSSERSGILRWPHTLASFSSLRDAGCIVSAAWGHLG